MIFGVRANFLKDFPLELLLSPRRGQKQLLEPWLVEQRLNSSKSNTDPVVISRQLGAANIYDMRRRKSIFSDTSDLGY